MKFTFAEEIEIFMESMATMRLWKKKKGGRAVTVFWP